MLRPSLDGHQQRKKGFATVRTRSSSGRKPRFEVNTKPTYMWTTHVEVFVCVGTELFVMGDRKTEISRLLLSLRSDTTRWRC